MSPDPAYLASIKKLITTRRRLATTKFRKELIKRELMHRSYMMGKIQRPGRRRTIKDILAKEY